MEKIKENFQEKLNKTGQEVQEALESNFYTQYFWDENKRIKFVKITVNNLEKFNQIIEDLNYQYFQIRSDYEKQILSFIPLPNLYEQENPHLMKTISSLFYNLRPNSAAFSFIQGSMLTYEILRRQAETDFLEEKLKKSF
jgi:hypothetical protein